MCFLGVKCCFRSLTPDFIQSPPKHYEEDIITLILWEDGEIDTLRVKCPVQGHIYLALNLVSPGFTPVYVPSNMECSLLQIMPTKD